MSYIHTIIQYLPYGRFVYIQGSTLHMAHSKGIHGFVSVRKVSQTRKFTKYQAWPFLNTFQTSVSIYNTNV